MHLTSTRTFLTFQNRIFTNQTSCSGDPTAKENDQKLANKPVGMLKDGNQTYLLKNVLLKPRYFKNIKAMDKALADGKIYAAILSDYDYSNYLKDHPEHVKAADATNDEQTAELFVKISDPAITSSQFVAVTYKNENF